MAETLSRRALWIQRLSGEVVRALTERMRSGALAAGARLPEAEALVAEFVTSDGVIARALEDLHAKGLIAPDSGGWVVTGFPAADTPFAVPQSQEATLADVIAVMEMRIGLESEAAARAAERRSEVEMQAIRDAAAAYDAAAQAGSGAPRADYRFHLAISAATGNRYFRELTDYLGPLFIPRMRLQLGAPGAARVANLETSQAEHRDIVAAIEAGDPDAARTAMRAHLTRALAMLQRMEA